jgi:hypothetical protein
MTSRYPAAWKISKITPIAKTNTPSSPADHRPISVLPTLSKAMEIIMRKQITVHIKSNGMMSYLQYGFRAKHSTTTKSQQRPTDGVRKKAAVNINPT